MIYAINMASLNGLMLSREQFPVVLHEAAGYSLTSPLAHAKSVNL